MPVFLFGQFFPKNQFTSKKGQEEETFLFSDERKIKYGIKKALVLRKSIKEYNADSNSKKSQKGALFAFTKPENKSASIAINAGFQISFSKIYFIDKKEVLYTKRSFAPYVQYDKNTLIENEQDNLLIGISYVNNTTCYEYFEGKSENFKKINWLISISGSYRNDIENGLEAFQSSALLSPNFYKKNKEGKIEKTSIFKTKDSAFPKFLSSFALGAEYDYRFRTKTLDLNGNLLRFTSLTKMELKFSKKFATSLGLQYRYALANSTGLSNKHFFLKVASLDFKPYIGTGDDLFKSIQPKISLIYEDGENPTNGFNNQSYYALALSLAI